MRRRWFCGDDGGLIFGSGGEVGFGFGLFAFGLVSWSVRGLISWATAVFGSVGIVGCFMC